MTTDIRAGGLWIAVHTPFRDDGALDEQGIEANIHRYADELGLQGVFFNGLYGEHWALTLEERKRIAVASAKAARGRIGLSPNCTHHSLAETIDLARHAEACGCEYVVLMNPATSPRTEPELFDWFRRVADAVTVDLIVFNTPAPGYTLTPEFIARLACSGRFQVLKAAGGSHEVTEARRLAGDQIIVSDPSEGTWLGNLIAYDQQLLYADAEPYLFQFGKDRPMQRMLDAYREGRIDEVIATYKSLAPMRAVYQEWISGPVRRGRASCAAIKHWAARRGLAAGPVRPPLSPLSPNERERFDRALSAVGI